MIRSLQFSRKENSLQTNGTNVWNVSVAALPTINKGPQRSFVLFRFILFLVFLYFSILQLVADAALTLLLRESLYSVVVGFLLASLPISLRICWSLVLQSRMLLNSFFSFIGEKETRRDSSTVFSLSCFRMLNHSTASLFAEWAQTDNSSTLNS